MRLFPITVGIVVLLVAVASFLFFPKKDNSAEPDNTAAIQPVSNQLYTVNAKVKKVEGRVITVDLAVGGELGGTQAKFEERILGVYNERMPITGVNVSSGAKPASYKDLKPGMDISAEVNENPSTSTNLTVNSVNVRK